MWSSFPVTHPHPLSLGSLPWSEKPGDTGRRFRSTRTLRRRLLMPMIPTRTQMQAAIPSRRCLLVVSAMTQLRRN
ncbi:unnamed protein product [Effrenium voratum]|nr:unnamed protein product [Effrenium voratum]